MHSAGRTCRYCTLVYHGHDNASTASQSATARSKSVQSSKAIINTSSFCGTTTATAITTTDPSEGEEDEKEEGQSPSAQSTSTQGDWYEIGSIVGEKPTRYRVRWQGVNPETLRPWKLDWVCLAPAFHFVLSLCSLFLFVLFVRSFVLSLSSFFPVFLLSPLIFGFSSFLPSSNFTPPMFGKKPSGSRGATGQEGRRDPRSRQRVGGAKATQSKQEAHGSRLRQ